MTDEERKEVARECVDIAMGILETVDKSERALDGVKLGVAGGVMFVIFDICKRFGIENPLDEEE